MANIHKIPTPSHGTTPPCQRSQVVTAGAETVLCSWKPPQDAHGWFDDQLLLTQKKRKNLGPQNHWSFYFHWWVLKFQMNIYEHKSHQEMIIEAFLNEIMDRTMVVSLCWTISWNMLQYEPQSTVIDSHGFLFPAFLLPSLVVRNHSSIPGRT